MDTMITTQESNQHQQVSLVLTTPQSFPVFPFDPPYSIQIDLMRHIYSAIEHRRIAIAESPTGTGKTLSLLSAALTWLDDDKYRARKGHLDSLKSDDAPEWVISQTRDRLRRELEADEQEYEEHLAAARKREETQRRKLFARNIKRQKSSLGESASEDEDSFLPDDEEGLDGSVGDEAWRRKPGYANRADSGIRRPACTKIFYASRTHSQLSQVMPELRRLRREAHLNSCLPPPGNATARLSIAAEGGKRKYDSVVSDADTYNGRSETRFVSLGSRKQLCLNEKVKAKGGDLDEHCRELLQAGGDKRCPYLPKPGDAEDIRLHEFRDQILASPKDIEDLIVAGQASRTCPYFASREAISQAEVVTLPYNLLIHRDAREALNIDLTNQVVVVDEAHNLISSLLALSTVTLPLRTLDLCLEQLSAYISRFKNRLASKHMLHLKRLYRLLHTLKGLLSNWGQLNLSEVMTVDDLLSRLGGKIEEINFLEIQKYLRKSKLSRKITAYTRKAKSQIEQKAGSAVHSELGTPPLYAVQEFITALAAASDDGRIIFTQQPSSQNPGRPEFQVKYQSLNPAPQFRAVMDAARSIILAGGTMSPMSDLTNQLFAHLPSERISLFSCNHITPESNLRTLVIPRGPRGGELCFKFSTMDNEDLLFELGQIVVNFVRIVPDGMVVFLPSYKMLETVKNLWEKKGIMDSILNKKKVFVESTADVHELLIQYAEEIRSGGKGALLLAVVGAKLSEGLNFSDGLARMVMVIGLPFTNLTSAELQERLKHADRLAGEVIQKGSMYGAAGKELYENMCMSSVNQSIGRAIRHKDDWSMIALVDMRYQFERIHNRLPKWIGKSLIVTQSFGQAIKAASQFFVSKRG
ncbi:DNA repair helicase [Multifurca ochricompacta]|uniref:ATP-dependent DNA helicase CHL1 n=1 Tax=Multifurca ochricompacta TaxID=376703 RepID=A0AAD4M785_9AGAM|nr:DNA repair helicase [Multifurca ochricompacta]